MDKDKYIITIFSSNTIRTGAHRRYLELVKGLIDRGYNVICIGERDFTDGRWL